MATNTPLKNPKHATGRVKAAAKTVQARRVGPTSSARTLTKTTDSKGRVVLGGRFANRAVIVEQLSETEVVVKLARVIPERESWLYRNPEALAAVRSGLSQAREGEITKGPDLDADSELAARMGE